MTKIVKMILVIQIMKLCKDLYLHEYIFSLEKIGRKYDNDNCNHIVSWYIKFNFDNPL